MANFHFTGFASVCLFFLGSSFPLWAEPTKTENVEIVEERGDPDPFGCGPGYGDRLIEVAQGNAARNTATVLLRYETYELPTISAIFLMDEKKEDSDKRANLLELVKKGEATVVECLVTRLEAGTASTLESLVEWIYPTEYEPPEGIPAGSPMNRPDEELTPMDRQLKVAMMHACPTAFDTKNLGVTLEAQIDAVSIIENHWDVSLLFTRVKHLNDATWVEDTIKMPIFGVTSSKHLQRMEGNKWSLLSSQAKMSKDGVPVPATSQLSFLKVEEVR